MKRDHGLAELQGLAPVPDVGPTEFPHRRWVNRVELAHRHPTDCSGFVECRQVVRRASMVLLPMT